MSLFLWFTVILQLYFSAVLPMLKHGVLWSPPHFLIRRSLAPQLFTVFSFQPPFHSFLFCSSNTICLGLIFRIGFFPIWDRRIKFSFSTLCGFVLLLSVPLFPSSLLITWLHLSFSLPLCPFPLTSMFSLLHLPLSFSLHFVTISLLSCSHLYLPHQLRSYFFCPHLLNPLYSH